MFKRKAETSVTSSEELRTISWCLLISMQSIDCCEALKKRLCDAGIAFYIAYKGSFSESCPVLGRLIPASLRKTGRYNVYVPKQHRSQAMALANALA